jgi:F-type H+-transporting ATPase subunit b
MDEILRQLGGIAVRAVPTFILVLLLHVYLKHIFFRPLERALDERYKVTEGARKAAAESLEKAEAKAAEYEAQIRAARAQIYAEQEQLFAQLHQERATQVSAARAQADAAIAKARTELGRELDAARQNLEGESEQLATLIADSVLGRRVA